MEVKINKEIQSYSESLFFGLSLRQCGFSLAAVLVSVGLCFPLKPYVGTETEKRHHLAVMPFFWWGKVDSNHRSYKQQIYSLSPLATREFPHIHFTFVWSR